MKMTTIATLGITLLILTGCTAPGDANKDGAGTSQEESVEYTFSDPKFIDSSIADLQAAFPETNLATLSNKEWSQFQSVDNAFILSSNEPFTKSELSSLSKDLNGSGWTKSSFELASKKGSKAYIFEKGVDSVVISQSSDEVTVTFTKDSALLISMRDAINGPVVEEPVTEDIPANEEADEGEPASEEILVDEEIQPEN